MAITFVVYFPHKQRFKTHFSKFLNLQVVFHWIGPLFGANICEQSNFQSRFRLTTDGDAQGSTLRQARPIQQQQQRQQRLQLQLPPAKEKEETKLILTMMTSPLRHFVAVVVAVVKGRRQSYELNIAFKNSKLILNYYMVHYNNLD